jgi:hypothetical protein
VFLLFECAEGWRIPILGDVHSGMYSWFSVFPCDDINIPDTHNGGKN